MNPAVIERAAITYYGEPRQAVKCMEECAELIEALSDTLNVPDEIKVYAREIKTMCKGCLACGRPIAMVVSAEQRGHIREELADVSIMAGDQMPMIFGPFDVGKYAKLMRLAGRLGLMEVEE